MSVSISAKKLRKGLEPLVAAIILIAITLVIAIAVVGWMLGVFGTTTRSEALTVYPNATLSTGNSPTLIVSVRNTGSANVTIDFVRLNVPSCNASVGVEIAPGNLTTITTQLGATCTTIAGVRYEVQIITRSGNIFLTSVVAG